MGGGLWTAFAFTLVQRFGWRPVWIFCLAMTLVWSVAAAVVCRRGGGKK